MEEQTFEAWECRVKEELAESDPLELLDLAQDTLLRLACSVGDAKQAQRTGVPEQYYVLTDNLKSRIARVAVLMDVLQLRYGDAAEEEEIFLKDIEKCLE